MHDNDDSRRRVGRSRAGFTLVELVFAASLLTLLGYFVTTLMISGSAAQRFAERTTRVTEIGQELISDLRREVTTSVRVLHDDAIGNAYLGLLDFSSAKAPIGMRLPTLNATGIFEQETLAQPRTGNALLFARHAWAATYTATGSGLPYQVDVHRIVLYYPAAEGAGPQPGTPIGLNLAKWVSEPLVDGQGIDRITDPADQAEILRNLLLQAPDDNGVVHPSAEVVWLRGEDPSLAGTLRHIQSSGTLANTPQAPRAAPWQVLRDPTWSIDGMLQYRHYSLATIYAPSGWGVGRFSVVSTAGSGFPHGFEVQLIGPTSARQLLIRLVLTSNNNAGHKAFAAAQAVMDARDI
jgi:type II secretory pathway pseudopilin PulG